MHRRACGRPESELFTSRLVWWVKKPHHGSHELTAKPCAPTRCNIGLNDSDLEIGTTCGEAVSTGKTSAPSTDYNDIGDCSVVHGLKVSAAAISMLSGLDEIVLPLDHSPRHLCFFNGRKTIMPIVVLHWYCLQVVRSKRLFYNGFFDCDWGHDGGSKESKVRKSTLYTLSRQIRRDSVMSRSFMPS